MNHSEIVSFLWGVADLIPGSVRLAPGSAREYIRTRFGPGG